MHRWDGFVFLVKDALVMSKFHNDAFGLKTFLDSYVHVVELAFHPSQAWSDFLDQGLVQEKILSCNRLYSNIKYSTSLTGQGLDNTRHQNQARRSSGKRDTRRV